jgi:lipopolysaccharide transport system permease protein
VTAVISDGDVRAIRPSRGFPGFGFGELWRHRELVIVLARRNITVRYKQTQLGLLWAVLQPLFTMVVFTFVFQRVAKISSDGVPYPIFSYAALLPWTLFATSLGQSSLSIVGASAMVGKVYFPRMAIPFATILSALVDFAVASMVLLGMMVYYGVYPNPEEALLLPFFILLAVTTALGAGLWLAALNVRYRDIQYIVPFLIQIGMFVTPVAYPATLVSQPLRTILALNPMTGVVEGFRWALLDINAPSAPLLLISAAVSLVLFASGVLFFRRMERTFADVI